MTPKTAYGLINKLIWNERLPKAKIVWVEKETMPHYCGMTIQDEVIRLPIILLSLGYTRWGKTLIHEMIHVAEPNLRHGSLFERLVELYWRQVNPAIKKRISDEN